jgi:hypothetical protein
VNRRHSQPTGGWMSRARDHWALANNHPKKPLKETKPKDK